eukprot:CAMPEP_0194341486 /NCGR_PEP_ID=MMETSP0171-20130528/89913_1 /TAXON_ID=218684 /ORGANISM="Corethron pennatum, Strain L29A3" /LENGTH=553 /DNA_ID=CAMNT_0039106861 /DNA_START=28 /DNA_END=1690 /DNA_ORIENTATION=-
MVKYLLVAAAAVLSSCMSSAIAQEFSFFCMKECISSFRFTAGQACMDCYRKQERFVLGGAQIPAGAIADLLQAKLGTGYTEMWCGDEDLPSGWHASADGGYTGCETTENFPGDGTTSHQSHAYVKAQMATLPRLQHDGSVWRGNELGMVVSNELFWDQVSPRTVLLGTTVEQHTVIRPVLMDVFSECDKTCAAQLRRSVRALFSQNSIAVQSDVKIWAFRNLFAIIFPGETNPIAPQEFVATQTSFTTLSTLTQMVPDAVAEIIELGTNTRATLAAYFDRLLPLVRAHYGDRVRDRDCAPTAGGAGESCVRQLTSAFLDTLLAAGGLSVPGAVSTGLWVLYGNTREANARAAYRDVFPDDYALVPGEETEFFLREHAPLRSRRRVSVVDHAAARATDDFASQYAGGVRKVLNLALANQDPNAWGRDAHQFRPKNMTQYHKEFVGFADFAVDDAVAGGAMNRKCPGKNLALVMGRVWFEEWDQGRWCTRDDSKFIGSTPFHEEFTLRSNLKRSGSACTRRWFWQSESEECCSGQCIFSHTKLAFFFLKYHYVCQ